MIRLTIWGKSCSIVLDKTCTVFQIQCNPFIMCVFFVLFFTNLQINPLQNSMVKFLGSHNMTMLYQIHIIMRCVIKGLHCISLLVWKPSIVCLRTVYTCQRPTVMDKCGICATSKASYQPVHTHSLIRAFNGYSLEYSFRVKLLSEHHLEFISLNRGCTGSSESSLVKIPHCWKSHGPRREKTCLRWFANNTGADQPVHSAQSDQCLCYSLFWIVSYLGLLQAKFQISR